MGFAQNLNSLMQANGMTKYQLAKEIGCHQTSITNWLENGTTPQKRTLEAVAAVFGVTSVALCSDTLITGEENKKKRPADDETLSKTKLNLIEKIKNMDENMVAALNNLADQVLALQDK